MDDWPPRQIFPSRSKPHRLPRCEYQRIYQPVFFAACTAKRHPVLLSRGLPGTVRHMLDHNAIAHGCELIACCLMSDHMHVLACVTREGGDVLSFFEGFKNGVANVALRTGTGRLWQRNYWDRHTGNDLDLSRCVQYIEWNPVQAGLARRPEDWPYTIVNEYPWRKGDALHGARPHRRQTPNDRADT